MCLFGQSRSMQFCCKRLYLSSKEYQIYCLNRRFHRFRRFRGFCVSSVFNPKLRFNYISTQPTQLGAFRKERGWETSPAEDSRLICLGSNTVLREDLYPQKSGNSRRLHGGFSRSAGPLASQNRKEAFSVKTDFCGLKCLQRKMVLW